MEMEMEMEIEKNHIYTEIRFRFHDVDWTIDGPLSGDLTAGILLGIDIVRKDLEINYNFMDNEEGEVIVSDELDTLNINFSAIDSELSDYFSISRTPSRIAEDSVLIGLKELRHGRIRKINRFRWWILDPETGAYFLYRFSSPEFIQGFISICNAFRVDFRKYIIDLPFKYVRELRDTIVYYEIQGYNIDRTQMQQLIAQAEEKYNVY